MCVVSFDSITYLDSNGASCQSVCGCMRACVRVGVNMCVSLSLCCHVMH